MSEIYSEYIENAKNIFGEISEEKLKGLEFGIYSVKTIMASYEVNIEDFSDEIIFETDGSLDGKIDYYSVMYYEDNEYRFLGNREFEEILNSNKIYKIDFHLFQLKDRNRGYSLNETFLIRSVLYDIIKKPQEEFSKLPYNDLIKELQKNIFSTIQNNKKIVKIYFYYVISKDEEAEKNKEVLQLRNVLKEELNSGSYGIELEFFNIDRLNDTLKSIINEKTFKIKFDKKRQLIVDDESMILISNLKDYFEFLILKNKITFRDGLSVGNVREFLGNNKVNSDIEKSLETEFNLDFWKLNNGITILVDDYNYSTKENNILILERPRVVNGLQTSHVIFNFFKKDENLLDQEQRHILIRIIKASDVENNKKISKATNNQSAIINKDMVALDTFQIQLQEEFEKNKVIYKLKRDAKLKKEDHVDATDVAKAIVLVRDLDVYVAKTKGDKWLHELNTYEKIFTTDVTINICVFSTLMLKLVSQELMNSEIKDIKSIGNNQFLYFIFVLILKRYNYKFENTYLEEIKDIYFKAKNNIKELQKNINESLIEIGNYIEDIEDDKLKNKNIINLIKNKKFCDKFSDYVKNK